MEAPAMTALGRQGASRGGLLGRSRPGALTNLVLALLMALAPAATRAAPPAPKPAGAPVESDPCSEEDARALIAQSQINREKRDYRGEVALLEQALEMLPPCRRQAIYSPLAQAYWEVYQLGKDELHLRAALDMFILHLESLTATEEQARATTEAKLAEVAKELVSLKAKQARRDAEDKRRKEELARLEANRIAKQAVKKERERQRQADLAKQRALAERERRRAQLHLAAGGATAGLGVVFLSAMAVGLQRGELVDREGAALAADPSVRPEDLRALLRQGTDYNRMAWATGTIGSALLISGAAVVAVAVWRRGAKRHTQAGLAPRLHGLEVRF